MGFPRMRCYLFVALLLCSMLLLTNPVRAERIILDDDLVVDYHPDSLTLKPGRRGTVEFIFDNSGNETQKIAFGQDVIKAPGWPGASFNPDFFELPAGKSQVVIVTIQSYATYFDNGYSECHIWIVFGHELAPIEDYFDPNTIEGGASITIQVKDDLSSLIIGTIGTCIVIAIFITVIVRQRGK